MSALAAVGAAVVGLGACGGSSSGSAGSGSAADGFKAMQGAVAGAKSLHFSGTSVDKDGTVRLAGDVTSAGDARFSVGMAGTHFNITIVGPATYMKADRAFWGKHGGGGATGTRLANLLGGKWVKIDAALAGDLTKTVRELVPRELSYCLGQNLGTLVDGGTLTVGGQHVKVVRDKGDKPGSEASLYYVASSGKPYLVGQHQTSARKPGGKLSTRCGFDDDTSTSSDVTVSRYGRVAPIVAPPGAIDLGAIGSGAGANTTA